MGGVGARPAAVAASRRKDTKKEFLTTENTEVTEKKSQLYALRSLCSLWWKFVMDAQLYWRLETALAGGCEIRNPSGDMNFPDDPERICCPRKPSGNVRT